MPVRVRCRCGQEIVLRYGEWVYVFLGLVLLSVLVNMLALLLLYLRLGDPPPPLPPAEAVREEQATGGASPLPGRSPGDRKPAELEETRDSDSGGKAKAPQRSASNESRPRGAETGAPAVARPLRSPSEDVPSNALLAHLVDGQEDEESVDSDAEPAAPAPTETGAQTPSQPGHPWVDEPEIVRLVLLERSLGTPALLAHAFLSDPDPRIRRRALDQVSAGGLPPSGTVRGSRARRLVGRAAGWLQKDPRGRLLLEAAGLLARGNPLEPPAFEDLDGIWQSLRDEAARLLSDQAVQAVRDHLRGAMTAGLDIVLLVDVTRSMEKPLESLRQEALWMLPALSWALPGSRVGLVLYRDEVEQVVTLSTEPLRDVLDALREARAEGGGDVTEGVHHGLREALSLGRLAWREGAVRNVVVLGDAPPPYPERAGLLLLAGQAAQQGDYRIHALAIPTLDEFHAKAPYLPALGRQGGGRSVVLESTERLGTEVLLCVFPRAAEPAIQQVVPTLERLFAG